MAHPEIVTAVLYGDEVKKVEELIPDEVDELVGETDQTNRISLLQHKTFRHVIGAFDAEGGPIAAGVFVVPKDYEQPITTEVIATNGHEPEIVAEARERVICRARAIACVTFHHAGVVVDMPDTQA